MITGANTNVRYRGVIFHVQTEDSGRKNPHIISHVYHRGTILASEKTEYKDQIGADDLESVVRGLIEKQHQSMLKRLKSGAFDSAIAERLGDTAEESDSSGDQAAGSRTETVVTDAPPRKPAAAASGGGSRTFGDGIVSQKPLDEVILDYLAEKARGRASSSGERPARKSRSSG